MLEVGKGIESSMMARMMWRGSWNFASAFSAGGVAVPSAATFFFCCEPFFLPPPPKKTSSSTFFFLKATSESSAATARTWRVSMPSMAFFC